MLQQFSISGFGQKAADNVFYVSGFGKQSADTVFSVSGFGQQTTRFSLPTTVFALADLTADHLFSVSGLFWFHSSEDSVNGIGSRQ